MKTLLKYILAAAIQCASAAAYSQISREADSLLTAIRSGKEDTSQVKELNNLGWKLLMTGNYREAANLAGEALDLSKKLDFKKGMSKACNTIGLVHKFQGNYPEAIRWLSEGLQIRKSLNDKTALAAGHGNLGTIYDDMGNYPKALEHHFASLRICTEINEKQGIRGNAYNNIGLIYWKQKNFADALLNFNASLKAWEQLQPFIAGNEQLISLSTKGVSNCHSNIGNILKESGNYQEALKNYFISLELLEKIGDKQAISMTLNNIGLAHKLLGNYPEAIRYYNKSLAIKKEINYREGIAMVYINLGNVELAMNQLNKASEHYRQARILSEEIRAKEWIKESYLGLSEVDSSLGNFRQALEHYKMYVLYSDSLINEENTRKTVQTQMQYDFDRKTAADSIKNAELIKQELIQHEQEIQQQKAYTYGGIIGFALMLVVAGVSFRAYRQKQKANIIISEQKLLVEAKQKEILDSIHYARRIQQSLLPAERYIGNCLKRLLH